MSAFSFFCFSAVLATNSLLVSTLTSLFVLKVHLSNLATFVMDVHKTPAGRREAAALLKRAYAAPRGDKAAQANTACNLAVFEPTAANAGALMAEAKALDAEWRQAGNNEGSVCVANYDSGQYAAIAGVPQKRA